MRLPAMLLLAAAFVAQQAPPAPQPAAPALRSIDGWIEQPRPPGSPWNWMMTSGDEKLPEWEVELADGRVCAVPHDAKSPPAVRPSFSTDTDEIKAATAFCAVDDGWLVAYDHGEFGGALCWFSADGAQHEKISDHRVVAFLSASDGVLAIQGLAHMNSSVGSLIRIARPAPGWHWVAATLAELPAAPCAMVRRKDGTLLIVVTSGVVSVDLKDQVKTLLHEDDLFWTANSAVLEADGDRLYVGLRRFVAQFELDTSQLRLLVPDASQLMKPAQAADDRNKPKPPHR
jgi:hypothetical protein